MKRHVSLLESVRQRTTRASRRATRGAFGLWAWSSGGCLRRGRETDAEHTEGLRTSRRTRKPARRGSTLLVVMALLGMLTLLGLIYFSFAMQEQQNSLYFADAARKPDDAGDDIDAIFDKAIKQLIQGGDYSEKNSALWLGRNSMLFNMLGYDLQPYSGPGVNLVYTNSVGGVPAPWGWYADQDHDGIAEQAQAGYDLAELNDSPAARPNLFERSVGTMPAPDVDYTFADHNNVWLSYDSYTWDFSTEPPQQIRVIKPSFVRPELTRTSGALGTFVPQANWSTAAGYGGRSFRPHPEHLHVWRQQTNLTPERRFLDPNNPADSALIAALPGASGGFPFRIDIDGDGKFNEQGVWDRVATDATTYNQNYEYDVATQDPTGTPDAVWMDLDLPVASRPTDNATYIPLIAFKVIDLGGRLNLNAVGNLSGDTRTAATSNFGNINITNPPDRDISVSSSGFSTFEINPIWALDTHPSEASSVTDHTSYFHAPTNHRQLGNMEWWWLNKGRVAYTTPQQIYAGRYGDANRVWKVLATGSPAISVQQSNSNLFPFPGVWDADDNQDANEGGAIALAGVLGGQTLPMMHPLALNGLGYFWNPNNAKQLDLRSLYQLEDANNNGVLDAGEDLNNNGILDSGPVMFLRYTSMGVGTDGSGNGNVGLLNANALNGALMRNSVIGANFAKPTSPNQTLVDDPTEMVVENKYRQSPYDEPLDAKDTLYLFMSKGDRDRVGLTSRVADLMPGNIVPGTAGAQYQLEVARRFTTENWDLKTFGLPRLQGVGPDGQPGQAGIDDNGNGIVDDVAELGWPGTDDLRAWEFNVDIDGNQLPEFPPQFTAGTGTERAFQPADPFRPQLRRLLTTEFGNTSQAQHTFRLNVNEFLDIERSPGTNNPNPRTAPLQYRALTPHSTDKTLTSLPPVSPLPAYPPTTEGEREFWARRDRQQMARDIYVMLYTFCGGNDTANLTNTSGFMVHPANVRRQMAQFAVNVVDALDRDNVITAFEYDGNLANGWNLDDDATNVSASEAPLVTSGERDVVFGVEAQELTFSETMWLWQDQVPDHLLTPFNDNIAGGTNFFQVELRSTSPKSVDLASTVSSSTNTGVWRIHRDDNNDSIVDATENAVTFTASTGAVQSVYAGGLFTIASADPSVVGNASLYIDSSGPASTMMMRNDELVAPNLTTGTVYVGTALPPDANLDLLHTSHSGYFKLSNGSAANGDLLSRTNNPAAGGFAADRTSLRLDRRLNPNCPQLGLGANPFITVDTVRQVSRRTLKIDGGVTSQADALSRLTETAPFDTPPISSQERRNPLDAGNVVNGASNGSSPHLNSIGQKNPSSPATSPLFQAHFDRDFASVIELFNVPLRGPGALTRILPNMRRPPEVTAAAFGSGSRGQLETGGPFTFGAAVLMTGEDTQHDGTFQRGEDANGNGILDGGEDGTNGNPMDGNLQYGEDYNGNGQLDYSGGASNVAPNHFHRLLSLVEVPTRTHRQLGDPLKLTRVPGPLNLNGISDPRVLAALFDDRTVMDIPERAVLGDINSNGQIDLGLPDRTGEPPETVATGDLDGSGAVDSYGRDWWFNFIRSRDGLDKCSGLPLPMSAGSPGTSPSRPFRDLGTMQPTAGSATSTSSLEDTVLRRLPISTNGRRIFELGNETEFLNGNVDPVLRHRLLSKIMANSTTRSNCFVVFVTIGMFECVELPNGAIRIGGQMDVDNDGQKDTHRAAFIIDRSVAEDAYDKGSKTFDWKKLVMAKQRVN